MIRFEVNVLRRERYSVVERIPASFLAPDLKAALERMRKTFNAEYNDHYGWSHDMVIIKAYDEGIDEHKHTWQDRGQYEDTDSRVYKCFTCGGELVSTQNPEWFGDK